MQPATAQTEMTYYIATVMTATSLKHNRKKAKKNNICGRVQQSDC